MREISLNYNNRGGRGPVKGKKEDMESKKELLENVAYAHDLEFTTTVEGGNNGYPRNMRGAIIGFDSWEQAEKFANEFGLSLVMLHKRDGWQMYERRTSVYEPLKNSAADYGDDYSQYSSDDYADFFENDVQPFLSDFDNFDDLQDFLDKSKKVYEELSSIDENQLVITCQGEYYDTIAKESMEWSHDTHHYIIGVVDYED